MKCFVIEREQITRMKTDDNGKITREEILDIFRDRKREDNRENSREDNRER